MRGFEACFLLLFFFFLLTFFIFIYIILFFLETGGFGCVCTVYKAEEMGW